MTKEEQLRKWLSETLVESKLDDWWLTPGGWGYKPEYINHGPTNIMIYYTKGYPGHPNGPRGVDPYAMITFVGVAGIGNGFKLSDEDGSIGKLFNAVYAKLLLQYEDRVANQILEQIQKNATLTQR